jgi:hypothetical protein
MAIKFRVLMTMMMMVVVVIAGRGNTKINVGSSAQCAA